MPPSKFSTSVQSSLSWVPPSFPARENKTAGGGGDSRMIVTSLMIANHWILAPWELLPWAPPTPHAASSSSVLIFIALNGGSPLLLPRHVCRLLSLKVWLPLHPHSYLHGSHQPFTLPFKRHVEVLPSERQKMGCGNNVHRGKGNNVIKPHYYTGPMSQDNGEQIPNDMSRQTMNDSTVGQELTINVGNRVTKIRESKIFALL